MLLFFTLVASYLLPLGCVVAVATDVVATVAVATVVVATVLLLLLLLLLYWGSDCNAAADVVATVVAVVATVVAFATVATVAVELRIWLQCCIGY